MGGGVRARRGRRADRPGGGRGGAVAARRARRASGTILEGESLVNDGTGLTAYSLAIAAIGATVTAGDVVVDFVVKAAGGIAIGLAAGWLFGRLRGATREPSIDLVLSILTPFVAYVPAEKIHVSGVLAVVTAGVVIGSRSQELAEAGARLRTLAFWQSVDFLLNSLLFLLIGLQLVDLVDGVDDKELVEVAGEAVVIAAVVLGVRLAWMFTVPAIAHLRIVPRQPTGVPRAAPARLERDARRRLAGGRARHLDGRGRARAGDPRSPTASWWSRSCCRGSRWRR